jgi:uncharacterized protein YcaQ
MEISSGEARRINLNAQLLDGRANLPAGKNGIYHIIQQLGYIQIDTISVIKRAHHHTLWSRQPDYREEELHELQAKDRLIFEYWGHAMSYLPLSDYRFYLPKMKNFRDPAGPWIKQQLTRCGHLLEPVLERIRKEGPLSSQDFEKPAGRKGGTWWDWKPAKMALELLFWQGKLMIHHRDKFQKVYDLTERVLPSDINTTIPDKTELGQFLVKRAVKAMGIADLKTISNFLQPQSSRDSDIQIAGDKILLESLRQLKEESELIELQVENQNDTLYYTIPESLNGIRYLPEQPSQIYLLSPFDNLIIQRTRTRRLFGFDYTLECYLPVAKRQYGYFNLPILWEENFIGRLDPKADRKNKTLLIRNLVFHETANSGWKFLPDLAQKIVALARFNECKKVALDSAIAAKIRSRLNPLVKKAFKN